MIRLNPALPEPAKKSLTISWKEGIPNEVMVWIVDYYLTAYGLFLGAAPAQIGWLVAIPFFVSSCSQLFVERIVRWYGSRLRFLRHAATLQAAVLVPAAFLAILPIPNRIPLLIAVTLVYRVMQSLTDTVWFSLMSDYLPAKERPGYFGARARIAGSAGVASLVLGGLLLYMLPETYHALGFFLLFITTAAARFISTALLSRMADIPLDHKPEHRFSFWMFIRRHKESNFVRYVFFSAATIFSVQLAGPYFSVHLLQDMKIDYLSFMIIHFAAVLVRLISVPRWGKHADLTGNARILKLTTLLFPFIPLLWILSQHMAWLILLQMFAGFLWAGYSLCSTNYIYDAVSSEKRVRCLGYWTLICGMGNAAGAFLGGLLAERLPPLGGYPILMLFLVSGIVRLAVHLFFSRGFREVREDARPASKLDILLSMLKIKTLFAEKNWNGRSAPAHIGDEF